MEGNKFTTQAVVILVVGILVGAGVGYAAFHGSNGNNTNTDDTYWFYIYFGNVESDTRWYSATGANSAVAFEKAMKAAAVEYEVNAKTGYLTSIGGVDGLWSMYNYLYTETTKTAAANSILYPVKDSMGLAKSNGWASCMGYDVSGDERFKIWEIDSKIFFFSLWTEDSPDVWSCPDPVTTTLWMSDTTGPFATA